ncbi:hypothetical protein JX265_013029 [Neoarthrinium moseri]|uniref:Retinol dehydrogenase 14 n=1 Tax=Neoarthrinium moseri TaxID=1658444 RepID=A0A9Q0AI25_9PEZI|nr:hypothetical protein JX266_013548 [Neoarthrinium moseri]KAI1852176.1 hypothetical protein JX265_013029 [Neoarthrinium moseri]
MSSMKEQFWAARHPPKNPSHLSFNNKVILVSGANDGLGFQAALKYAQLGASTLILGVRSKEKGEAAKVSIIQQTQCSNITVMTVDLSTFASVKDFARRVNEEVPQLHVVLLCAGIMTSKYEKSPDGFEMALQVNVLSTALMVLLLLPKLQKTVCCDGSIPHLCIVNSLATQEIKPELIPTDNMLIQRLNDASKFDFYAHYYLVKLAARFFVQELATQKCADPDTMVINCCCPGMCRTKLLREFPLVLRLVMAPYRYVCGRSAEEGSRTLVSATALGSESNGKLWLNDELPPPGPFMASQCAADLSPATFQEILTILRQHCDLEGML